MAGFGFVKCPRRKSCIFALPGDCLRATFVPHCAPCSFSRHHTVNPMPICHVAGRSSGTPQCRRWRGH
eukprot:3147909-Lingulodinium_polyedra.AAC.1